MLQPDYTEKESKLFTGRTSYIRQVEDIISKKNIAAVIAPSGLGRTAMLRHLAAKHRHIYLDLRRFSTTPESFSVELIGTVCFFHLAKDASEFGAFQGIEKLKELKLGSRCTDIISTVDNELQKIKPDQELLLTSAFGFAEKFAAEHNRKVTITLNSFDEILKLNNFSQVKDILDLFFTAISKNKDCCFIISASSAHMMRNALKRHAPDIVELQPLSLLETKELFEKAAGKSDERVIKEVHSISAGMPFIVRSIASRFREERSADAQKNIKLVRYILTSDLASVGSAPYSYCSRLFIGSLNRARGESLLKAILKAVSQNRPLRLTEIARLIYRSGPVTKSLLERLIEVDLLVKTGNTFDFANPVLKIWCRLMFSNVEFSETPDEKSLAGLGGLL
ncbi:hypothetical protein JW898_00535 [Candidatus Woesearchaeota archaeon]|nr:hypothetical protein [Candidatus Woesearchaeota archaeon]